MTNREVAFHDAAVADINDFIAVHPPERGGALLGPVGQPVVSRFLPDPRAAVTGVTYTPSQALRDAVAQIERSGVNLELKGMIHSHPSGMAHPSGGDHRAFADTLAKAPWLGRGIFPIVTADARREADQGHRIQLRAGNMSVFVAEARVGGAIQVEPARPRVIPFSRDVAVLASGLGVTVESHATITAVGDTLYAAAILRSGATEVTALFPPLYPMAPPLILLTPRGEDDGTNVAARIAADLIGGGQPRTVALPLAWDMNMDEERRLATALDGALHRAGGTREARPTMSLAGSSAGDDDGARDGLRARLDGAVDESLRKAKILLVGLGSGGSQTAEALARASVEQFIMIDPDKVGPENLSRSVYQFADVGKDKTQALAERLTAINPAVDARQVTASLDEISDEELAKLVSDSSLVIAATDDPKAQLRLNHLAWTLGRPAVFGGVYKRGVAGEVIFTVPRIPGVRCFQCATGGRRDGASQGEMNYGTGQLIAEPALGSDISHIVMASVKIAIGLLELGTGGVPHSAGNLVATALAKGYQYVILSTVPGYDFFPRLFGDTDGQHAYQSVWMNVAGNPDCPTCGVSPLDVGEYVTSGPDLSAIRPIASPSLDDGEPGDPAPEGDQPGGPAPAVAEQPGEQTRKLAAEQPAETDG
jgi:proteasome lid subunit RPN8/RPN11